MCGAGWGGAVHGWGTLGSAFVCLLPDMGCFGMGKKSRARVAAAGTRKDPGRRVAEGKKVDRVEKDKKVFGLNKVSLMQGNSHQPI